MLVPVTCACYLLAHMDACTSVKCVLYLAVSIKNGWTCVHHAAQQGHPEALAALITAGADVNIRSEVAPFLILV